jgi:hypothetical protein
VVDPGVATFAAATTPVLAFGGAVAGQLISRKGARELEVRWRREETMRLLRWAAQLAVDDDTARSAVGVAALTALGVSELLHRADEVVVSAVLDAVLDPVAVGYSGAAPAAEEAD